MSNTTINSLKILFVYYNILPKIIKIEQINYPTSILIIYIIESPCHMQGDLIIINPLY